MCSTSVLWLPCQQLAATFSKTTRSTFFTTMSNSSSTANFIASMQYATGQMNTYTSTILLFFGIFGNLLNLLVFLQPALRLKPCVIYFLTASITNLIGLLASLMPRTLQSFFMIPDQTEISSVICKLRITFLFPMRTISSWLIVLATVDRYLISSLNINRRQFSKPKNAFYSIVIVFILSFLLWAESIYCFDLNQGNTPQRCYAKSDSCRIYNDLTQSLVTTLIPSTIMLIFGLLTIQNIKASKQVQPSTVVTLNSTNRKARREDRSLTLMLIVQILLLTVFSLPMAVQKFYLTYTFYQSKTPNQRAIESFVFAFVVQLLSVPSCMTFYLYTITGSVFRKTLLKSIKNAISYFKCW